MINVKIEKTCKTCANNFPDKNDKNKRVCAGAYYGKELKNLNEECEYWKIGMNYWFELRELLTEKEIRKLDNNVSRDADELLIEMIESK